MDGGAAGGITEITEGSTRLLVPAASLSAAAPPHEPAFFNPRAAGTRDFAVLACAAHAALLGGEALVLDCMAGLGARAVRVAAESGNGIRVVANDLNDAARRLAQQSAELNGCSDRLDWSGEEACRFLSSRAARGRRGTIVDVDPFGSPARYLDCALRATAHGGMLAVTATDLQVLHGIFPDACERIYGGTPVRRSPFAKEAALRLVLGCLGSVAARLGARIDALFCESDMHYYRAYVRVGSGARGWRRRAYLYYCASCGARGMREAAGAPCAECGQAALDAGPLWPGELFEPAFVAAMRAECGRLARADACARTLEACAAECGMPAAYYPVDEAASRARSSPRSPEAAAGILRDAGYCASRTSLDPTAIRTDAPAAAVVRACAR